MAIFKFKDRNRCRARMEARWPGGLLVAFEDTCRLQIGHEGPHRGESTGTVWDNADRRLVESNPRAPRVFLGSK